MLVKQVFKGRLLRLDVERRRFPNGYVGNLEVVTHPGAVLIVPVLGKDRVVMIRQYRPVIKSNIWELPAGTLGKGEATLSCAKRELAEETGYVARTWKKLGFIYPAPGYTTEKIIIYKATRLSKTRSDIQEDEVITPRILSKPALAKLLKAGRITDAKTIAALSLARFV
ncbi:NUDIX domain-containing protein [Candidatus Omnitrophota bacterium]